MTDKEQLERFGEAVEEKKQRAKEASEAPHPETAGGSPVFGAGEQAARVDDAYTQNERSVRDKDTGKGKKTADKWNQ